MSDDESMATALPAVELEARVARGVIAVREGHGANCSSIGSVIDTLYLTAAVGSAVFAAVVAAIAKSAASDAHAHAHAHADANAHGTPAPKSPPDTP
jgi:hypothetical protein